MAKDKGLEKIKAGHYKYKGFEIIKNKEQRIWDIFKDESIWGCAETLDEATWRIDF